MSEVNVKRAIEYLDSLPADAIIHPKGLKKVLEALAEPQEKIYPCKDCATLRINAEGDTTFTVCDDCLNKLYKKESQKQGKLISREEFEAIFKDWLGEPIFRPIYDFFLQELWGEK